MGDVKVSQFKFLMLMIILLFVTSCSIVTRPNPDLYNSRVLNTKITPGAEFQLLMSPSPEDILKISSQELNFKIIVNNLVGKNLEGKYKIWTFPAGDKYGGVEQKDGEGTFDVVGLSGDKKTSSETLSNSNTENVNFFDTSLLVFGELRYEKEGSIQSDNICLIKDLSDDINQICKDVKGKINNPVTIISNGAGYSTNAKFVEEIAEDMEAKTAINNFKIKFNDEDSNKEVDSVVIEFIINEGDCDIIPPEDTSVFTDSLEGKKLDKFFPNIQITFRNNEFTIDGEKDCSLDEDKSNKNQKAIKCVVPNKSNPNKFDIQTDDPNEKINIQYDYGCKINLKSSSIAFKE